MRANHQIPAAGARSRLAVRPWPARLTMGSPRGTSSSRWRTSRKPVPSANGQQTSTQMPVLESSPRRSLLSPSFLWELSCSRYGSLSARRGAARPAPTSNATREHRAGTSGRVAWLSRSRSRSRSVRGRIEGCSNARWASPGRLAPSCTGDRACTSYPPAARFRLIVVLRHPPRVAAPAVTPCATNLVTPPGVDAHRPPRLELAVIRFARRDLRFAMRIRPSRGRRRVRCLVHAAVCQSLARAGVRRLALARRRGIAGAAAGHDGSAPCDGQRTSKPACGA